MEQVVGSVRQDEEDEQNELLEAPGGQPAKLRVAPEAEATSRDRGPPVSAVAASKVLLCLVGLGGLLVGVVLGAAGTLAIESHILGRPGALESRVRGEGAASQELAAQPGDGTEAQPATPGGSPSSYTPSTCSLVSQQSAWRLEHLTRGHIHHMLRHKFHDHDFHVLRVFIVDVLRMNRKVPNVDFVGGLGMHMDPLGLYMASQHGHEVHIIEPVKDFIDEASSKLPPSIKSKVVFHNNALGETVGTAKGNYKGNPWSVQVRPIGDILKGKRVFSGSMDIHGYEAASIYGMGDILPDILLFEVMRSPKYDHAMIEKLMRYLDDKGYVVFDFMPSGERASSKSNSKNADSFKHTLGLEDVFSPDNLCSARSTSMSHWFGRFVKDTPVPDRFKWLQTDIIAIQRTVLTQEMLDVFSSVVCTERGLFDKIMTKEDYAEGSVGVVRRCFDPTGLMRQYGLALGDNTVFPRNTKN